jgi:hypothetical protein
MTPTASYRIKPLVWEKVKGGQAQYRARVANIFNFYATRKAPRSRQWEREIFVGEECRDYEVHATRFSRCDPPDSNSRTSPRRFRCRRAPFETGITSD